MTFFSSSPLSFLYAFLIVLVQASPVIGAYTPVAYALGSTPTSSLQNYSGSLLTLDASNPVLTLDYGAEVAGFPFVEVAAISGSAVQVELKYSEPFDGLSLLYGEDPW